MRASDQLLEWVLVAVAFGSGIIALINWRHRSEAMVAVQRALVGVGAGLAGYLIARNHQGSMAIALSLLGAGVVVGLIVGIRTLLR